MFKNNLLIKLFIVLLMFSPAIAFAYTTPSLWPTGYWGPIVSCNGNYLQNGANGTCQSLCDLINTATNAVYLAMTIAIFVLAPILFVVGAIMLLVSGANPEMLSRGKKTLTDTLIGLIIVLCSYLIVNTVVTTLKINGIGGFGASSCSLGGAGTSFTCGGTTNGTCPNGQVCKDSLTMNGVDSYSCE
jgi:hypothetical protein